MILLIALLLAQADNRVKICDKANPTRCATVGSDGKVAVAASVNVAGAADVVSTGAPTTFNANAVCTGALLLAGEQGAGFQLDSGGTLVATLTPQYSLKDTGSDWTTTQFIDQNGSKSASIAATNPTPLSQFGIVVVTGARRVQVCTTAYTSGSATGFAVAAYVQGGASAGGSSGLTDTQLRASPVPVSAAFLPLPAGAATEATLAGVKTGTDKIPASPATDRSTAAAPFSTRLSDGAAFYKATTPSDTQPVSAASLPLPSGAATESTLAAIKTDVDKIPASPSTDRATAGAPFSVRLSDGAAFFDPRDISDRVGRALGVVSITGSVAVTGTFWQATQPVSGTFWQATQPVSGTFWQTTQPVSLSGALSAGNSSSAALGIGATFTGTFESVKDYATITTSVFADQASASSGLNFDWSHDGTNTDVTESSDVLAGTGRAFNMSPRAQFFRVRYVNGGSAQSTFRLGVVYHPTGTGMITKPLDGTLTTENFAQSVRAVVTAKDETGSGFSSVSAASAAPAPGDIGLVTRNIPSGTQYVYVVSPPLNPILPRCNAVRRSNCQP